MLDTARLAAVAAVVVALAAPVAAAEGEERARPRSATGEVVAVDTEAGTLVVQGRSGEAVTFVVAPATRVLMARRRVPLSSLAPGQRVRVTYESAGGRGVATRITILAPRLTPEGRPG